jgi:hypothetical protein
LCIVAHIGDLPLPHNKTFRTPSRALHFMGFGSPALKRVGNIEGNGARPEIGGPIEPIEPFARLRFRKRWRSSLVI